MGLGVVAQPQFKTVESLRGKKICVDAPKSGFAYVIYKILLEHGLKPGDYEVDPIGGVFIRFQALLAGKCDATLLSLGFEVKAAAAGKVPLDTVLAVSNPYLATCSAGKRDWMQAHRDLVVRYERATYKALRWMLDPANRAAAVALLTDANTPAPVAEKLFDSFLDQRLGLIRDMELELKGLRNVLALRAEYGGFDAPQQLDRLATPEGGLYDLSYLKAAKGG
jgi:ABC-type nitrate/sulfonate/bicarbonate transport system substrate-binding protein